MIAMDECHSDLLSAGLTVVLTDLDINKPKETLSEQTESLRSAEKFILHMLTCTPTDGDAWARLAMVRQALGYSPQEVIHLLEKSASYAPAEGSTVAARLEVWRRVADSALNLAEPALDHDIFVALNYYSLQDAAKTLAGGGQRFRDTTSAIATKLPAGRVSDLQRQGLEIGQPVSDGARLGY